MQTREKILAAAITLYNEKGIQSITSRHIATQLGISAGNLHYHFKHTEDIISALYNRLAGSFDELMLGLEKTKNVDLDLLAAFTTQSLQLAYRYRFIFLHFVEIGARIPAIQQNYQQLTQRRQKEFKRIFKKLVKEGVFRADIPDEVWSLLVTQLFILGDFWLLNNELTRQLREHDAIDYYKKVFEAVFYPFLIR